VQALFKFVCLQCGVYRPLTPCEQSQTGSQCKGWAPKAGICYNVFILHHLNCFTIQMPNLAHPTTGKEVFLISGRPRCR